MDCRILLAVLCIGVMEGMTVQGAAQVEPAATSGVSAQSAAKPEAISDAETKDHAGELRVFSAAVFDNNGISGVDRSAMLGMALTFQPWMKMDRNVEVRAVYPVSSGDGASEKSVMAGLSLSHTFKMLRPYGDFLYGRGRIEYPKSYEYNDYVYVNSATNIYSPGGGVDVHLLGRLSLKADFQYQHWHTAAVSGGHVWSEVGSVGLSYRFKDSLVTRKRLKKGANSK